MTSWQVGKLGFPGGLVAKVNRGKADRGGRVGGKGDVVCSWDGDSQNPEDLAGGRSSLIHGEIGVCLASMVLGVSSMRYMIKSSLEDYAVKSLALSRSFIIILLRILNKSLPDSEPSPRAASSQ
jgi:hypothetical protein